MVVDPFAEVRSALEELGEGPLDGVAWEEVGRHVVDLDRALLLKDEVAFRASALLLNQALFEARVRSKFGPHRERRAGLVEAPTKNTPALPIVGAVCAAILIAAGFALGGGAVLLGTTAFAVFIFVVAMSGSRLAHDRGSTGEMEEAVSIPSPRPQATRADIERLINHLKG